MSHILYTSAQCGLTLAEAVKTHAAALSAAAAGLLYAPGTCRLARLTGGALTGPGGDALDIGGVYEARLFSPAAELRWLSVPGGSSRTVLLSEKPLAGLSASLPYLDTISQQYLLWGSVKEDGKDGWSRLVEARLGSVTIPLECRAGQTVKLTAREYLGVAEDDEHGNVVVLEELLRELQVNQ